MKHLLLKTLLFLSAGASCQAAMPRHGHYQIDTRAAHPPWFIMEHDNMENNEGMPDNPQCKDGLIQTPPPITNLHAFFAGHTAAHAADRGEDHYLPGRNGAFAHDQLIGQHHGIQDDSYVKLNFNLPAIGTSIRAVPVWFDSSGMLTSTCLARARHRLDQGPSQADGVATTN